MSPRRRGFTLFELILAMALSAMLLALIGTAINLYLMRVDASRTRVEEAQLARSILAMIADDIRATTIYEPQDTSAIAELMASSRSADDDDDDGPDDDGATEGPDGVGGTGSSGGAMTIGTSTSSSGGDSSSSDSSSNSDSSEEADDTLPLGLSGTLAELYIDVTRLPRREELFGTITGYTNAPMPVPTGGGATGAAAAVAVEPPSDLKTVRYFIRQGEQVDPGTVAAMSLSPERQQRAGGLVRQQIPRAMRSFAERNGNSAMLDSGQMLVAPEVVYLEFRYYDGQQVTEIWDMQQERSLPLAVEVRIWLASPEAAGEADDLPYDLASLVGSAREYRQTVYLPMSAVSGPGASGTMGESSSGSSSFDSSSSSGSSPSPPL